MLEFQKTGYEHVLDAKSWDEEKEDFRTIFMNKDDVADDVADDAAAGLAAIESPGVLAVASEAGEVAEPEMERLAQVALVDQSLQVLVHWHVAVGEGHEGDRLCGGRSACARAVRELAKRRGGTCRHRRV